MQGAPYLTPPYQNLTTSAVLLILNSTRANDIPNVIRGLDQEQQAHLMAYLYKVGGVGTLPREESADACVLQNMSALGSGADIPGSVLLTWHEKVGTRPLTYVWLTQPAHRGGRCRLHRARHDRPSYTVVAIRVCIIRCSLAVACSRVGSSSWVSKN